MSGAKHTWFYRNTDDQPQTGANILVILLAYRWTASVRCKIYAGDFIAMLVNSGSQSKYTGNFIAILVNSLIQEQNIYWWCYHHTGEQPQSGAKCTSDFIGVLMNSLSQEQNICCWFYRHTGKQPQSGAKYIGDFIGILLNSLSHGENILVFL